MGCGEAEPEQEEEMGMEKLRSVQPAESWFEGLPLGNGSFGAMVEGGIAIERILFNHERLYLPFDNDFEMERDPAFTDRVKQEVMKGNYKKAEKMLEEKYPVNRVSPYQPLCELIIRSDIRGEKTGYVRELDFKTAQAAVSWTAEGVRYTRRQFVSRADGQFVLEIGNDAGRKMDSTFSLNARLLGEEAADRYIRDHFTVCTETHTEGWPSGRFMPGIRKRLSFEGRYHQGGRFGAVMRFVTDGEVTTEKDSRGYDRIRCSGYTRFTAYVTGYAFGTPTEPVLAPYEELLERHLKRYAPLYNRVKLELGYFSGKSTEELLLEASCEKPDPAMYELMFHYSRYLFLSCAVDCEKPPNLQGIWNGDYEPGWQCDFHNDENVQICMWQGLSLGMPESVKTYMDYYSGCMEDYRQNALRYYNAQGIAAPVSQTVSGKGLSRGMWNLLPGMAGWIGQLFFEYWLYTKDRETLEKQIVPFLEEVAKFYMSYCTVTDGTCHFIPSFSPENEPKIRGKKAGGKEDDAPSILSVDSTFDVAVAKEVFTNLIKACEILGRDASEYRKMLERMPEYKINGDGALKEWLPDELEDNYEHRHLSHLYPAFPGNEIREDTDKRLFEAVKTATMKRLGEGLTSQTGWSLTHLAAVFARLGMGEESCTCLKLLLRTVVMKNLLTRHNDYRPQGNTLYWDYNPFQIDAALGFAHVMTEMFVCSGEGYIRIAPAVPKLFWNARISGIAAKGRISVDIEMEEGRAKVVLTAEEETALRLYMNGRVTDVVLQAGENRFGEEN